MPEQSGTQPQPSPRPVCPTCGSAEKVFRLAYGKPSPEMLEQARRGEFMLGGCCVDSDSPSWYCRACKKTFGREVN